MNDQEAIKKIKGGKSQILDHLYLAYRGEFLNWVKREFECSHEDSLDYYQTSIVILYENILNGKLDKLGSSIKTYLFAIGKNKAREGNRKKKRLGKHISEMDIEIIDEEFDWEAHEKLMQTIGQSLDKLGEPCKSILTNYYYKKMSMQEIASSLDYKNTATVKNMKYKCLVRLRKLFLEVK